MPPAYTARHTALKHRNAYTRTPPDIARSGFRRLYRGNTLAHETTTES